jgi:hypothetical protein
MAKKNVRRGKPGKQKQNKTTTMSVMVMGGIVAVIVFFVVIMGFFMKESDGMDFQENYQSMGTDPRCPSTIKFEGKTYDHLRGHDLFQKRKQGYGSCDFDILSCIYGRDCMKKTLDDGKKLGRLWRRNPVCGRNHHNKTFEFCNKDDLVAVHMNIERKGNPIVWAGKTTYTNPNGCVDKYGVSADKGFNNANIGLGLGGFVGHKECWGTSDLSQFEVVRQ